MTTVGPRAEESAPVTETARTDRGVGSLAEAPSSGKRLLGVERVERERWSKFKIRDADATSANLLIAFGATLTFVGLVHLGVLWTPTQIGRPSWEFGTLSQTFTNVPLTVTGLVLIIYGKVRHPRTHPAWPRRAAIGMVALALLFALMGALYALTLPDVFRQAPPHAIEPLVRTIARNGAEIVAYPLVCLVIALLLWRGVERME